MIAQYTACLLRQTAADNGLRLRFSKIGRLWECRDTRGKQLWCGTLSDMRRLAMGKPI
jgi:hypothetical protein